MLPSIPSENSGGLEATRAARSAERTTQSVAQAPQNADAGEVDRSRRVDGVELTRRGERLADARRRARADDDRGRAPGDGVGGDRTDARAGRLDENEGSTPRAPDPGDATSRESGERADEPDRAALGVTEADTTDVIPRPPQDEEAPARVSTDELRELRDLQRSDRQVRSQENLQRQMAAEFVRGAPVYEYVEGPDGRRYAVAADSEFELPDLRSADPREAVRDAASARRAALASAVSSPSEQAFAARAASAEARARAAVTREVANIDGDAVDLSDEARRRAIELYEESIGRVDGTGDAQVDTSAA